MTYEIKNQLAEIAALLRSSSRKRKFDPIKQSLLNKGFDTTKEKGNKSDPAVLVTQLDYNKLMMLEPRLLAKDA